ncbi:MAG: DNA methylase [Ruminococcus sp.]|nr:DNA methylase [Ruminococcus sp.]
MNGRKYIAIDLKSFYASVECAERGLDPMKTNLVVADLSRTSKTICLAVSPSLKLYGIPGRARLFEVVQRVKSANAGRLISAPEHKFIGSSANFDELNKNPSLSIDYIVAKPQMAKYMKCSTEIFQIYLKYIAPEDIHVYSIDEVFIDATEYLKTYKTTAQQLASLMMKDVLNQTGITATAGIGTNLYLAKIAMDIDAKHMQADKYGMRISELDEMSYRKRLWTHKPITDFWRVGKGYAKKLEKYGIYTMGDIARCSLKNEDLLYKLFGVNAELLIDHAWGWEPCTISDIKSYKPENTSSSLGQVLSRPYDYEKARLIVREMTELLVLDLVDKGLATNQIVLTVGYDIQNLKGKFNGEITTDRYGRQIPKQAHGSENIGRFTSSTRLIVDAAMRLFDRIVDKELLVRRMYVVANHTVDENTIVENPEQLNLFTDLNSIIDNKEKEKEQFKKEKSIQKTILSLQKRFGKNAVIKCMNLQDGATTIERNSQIGGHKA